MVTSIFGSCRFLPSSRVCVVLQHRRRGSFVGMPTRRTHALYWFTRIERRLPWRFQKPVLTTFASPILSPDGVLQHSTMRMPTAAQPPPSVSPPPWQTARQRVWQFLILYLQRLRRAASPAGLLMLTLLLPEQLLPRQLASAGRQPLHPCSCNAAPAAQLTSPLQPVAQACAATAAAASFVTPPPRHPQASASLEARTRRTMEITK